MEYGQQGQAQRGVFARHSRAAKFRLIANRFRQALGRVRAHLARLGARTARTKMGMKSRRGLERRLTFQAHSG
jgi:hypothetical protein